ncbi:hypothetical protein [Hyphomicrobium sp. DY-1]|uniref:hypothetical protein n=1 Tax=Hyphomicrobium sp. DY-1 TaxID=3075650 RepID=UPI0039C40718
MAIINAFRRSPDAAAERERARQQAIQEQRDAEARAKDEQRQKEYDAYTNQRPRDIMKALARRISTGDAGMPFLILDSLVASAVTGAERREAPDVDAALEDVKNSLWFQCRHLGGDAVLYTTFRFEKGVVAFTNKAAVAVNIASAMFASASRGNFHLGQHSEQERQTAITVTGMGTAVKLFPSGSAMTPEMYHKINPHWLDLRLPDELSHLNPPPTPPNQNGDPEPPITNIRPTTVAASNTPPANPMDKNL